MKNYYTDHWNYEIVNLGYKYNMNDLMASIGLSQLKKLNWINYRRSMILKKYIKNGKEGKGKEMEKDMEERKEGILRRKFKKIRGIRG